MRWGPHGLQSIGSLTMKLTDFLADKRSSVLKRWLGAIFAGYPERTATFLRNEKDRFGNPVGSTYSRETEALFDALLADGGRDAFTPPLEAMVKIRAVQDFTASQAVGFMLQLKAAIRAELERCGHVFDPAEVMALDDRIDGVMLLTFDLFMGARETLYRIRSDELRRQTEFLVRRASRAHGSAPQEAGD